MAEESKIEWCDGTFNGWIGCTKVSPGCDNCYAEHFANRFGKDVWGRGKPRERTSGKNWMKPLLWNKRAGEGLFCECLACGKREFRKLDKTHPSGVTRCSNEECSLEAHSLTARPRIFSASLSDWLDPEIPVEWLMDLLNLVRTTPHLDWLLLSKRPEKWDSRIDAVIDRADHYAIEPERTKLLAWMDAWKARSFPENVWIGTTVENQGQANNRIKHLLNIPAMCHFLSCEPLLGPVDLELGHPKWRMSVSYHSTIDWVIVGGESGPGARPMHPDWASSLAEQCFEANVPFLFKQWGEYAPVCPSSPMPMKKARDMVSLDKDGNLSDIVGPGKSLMWKAGKAESGRILNGIEHNGLPRIAI